MKRWTKHYWCSNCGKEREDAIIAPLTPSQSFDADGMRARVFNRLRFDRPKCPECHMLMRDLRRPFQNTGDSRLR